MQLRQWQLSFPGPERSLHGMCGGKGDQIRPQENRGLFLLLAGGKKQSPGNGEEQEQGRDQEDYRQKSGKAGQQAVSIDRGGHPPSRRFFHHHPIVAELRQKGARALAISEADRDNIRRADILRNYGFLEGLFPDKLASPATALGIRYFPLHCRFSYEGLQLEQEEEHQPD